MEEFEDNLLNHVDPVQRRQLRVMYHITCKLKCPLRVGGGDQAFPKNNSNFLNLHRKVPHPPPSRHWHNSDLSYGKKIWIVRPIVCHSDL